MLNNLPLELTFDDVLISTKYSALESRSDVNLKTKLVFPNADINLNVPIISAPMSTVTDSGMMLAMRHVGGMGILHRFDPDVDNYISMSYTGMLAVSPSMWHEGFINAVLYECGEGGLLCVIDVAHGNNKAALNLAETLVKLGVHVVSGNIATVDAAKRYYDVGVNVFRVGIGGGAACSTRVISGVGHAQLHALSNIREAFPNSTILSDGGHRNSGDIAKALVFADAVILGRLLAGTNEVPVDPVITQYSVGDWGGTKTYPFQGMASKKALQAAGKTVRVEGVSGYVDAQGPVADVVNNLCEGIRASLAYVGAKNLTEFRQRVTFTRITQNGLAEGRPRI